MLLRASLLASFLLLLGSQLPAQTPAAAPPEAVDSASSQADLGYHLVPTDKVRLTVFNEPKFSGPLEVSDAGALPVPFIGDVPVAGLTLADARDLIQRKLADGYLRDPRVSLTLISVRPFFVYGEVSQPGKFDFTSGLTVTAAIAEAGGFTYRAKRKQVYIQRNGREFKVPADPSVRIAPGDTIRVGERHF